MDPDRHSDRASVTNGTNAVNVCPCERSKDEKERMKCFACALSEYLASRDLFSNFNENVFIGRRHIREVSLTACYKNQNSGSFSSQLAESAIFYHFLQEYCDNHPYFAIDKSKDLCSIKSKSEFVRKL